MIDAVFSSGLIHRKGFMDASSDLQMLCVLLFEIKHKKLMMKKKKHGNNVNLKFVSVCSLGTSSTSLYL